MDLLIVFLLDDFCVLLMQGLIWVDLKVARALGVGYSAEHVPFEVALFTC